MGTYQSKRLEERIGRELLVIGLCIGLALLQVTLLSTPLGFSVPLLLILVVCRVAVAAGSPFPDNGIVSAVRWSFYGGITLDLLSATPLGTHALALLLVALSIAVVTQRLQTAGPMVPLVAALAGAVVYEGVLAAVYALTVAPVTWQIYTQFVLIPSILVTLIPTLPTFFVMYWFFRLRS